MSLVKTVVFMVVGFEGLRIVLLPSYQAKAVGLIMLLAGYLVLKKEKVLYRKRRVSFLPYVGVLVILGDIFYNLLIEDWLSTSRSMHSAFLGDIFYNLLIEDSTAFLGLDWMTLLFGGMLMLYNFLPQKYETEARFLVIFLGLFFLTISLPLAILSLNVGSKAASYYNENFIARPLAFLLNSAGIKATSRLNWVFFEGRSGPINLGMGISCSGAYSFAVFFSAFTAYVYVRYGRVSRRIVGLLLMGLAGTYVANLIRVFITAVVGFYYGKDALILAHKNLGWIIFMLWVAVFWYVGFRILPCGEDAAEDKPTEN